MEMFNSGCPVPVLQARQEFEQLIDVYYTRQPKNVLEIGSLFGGTLYHWITLGTPDTNFTVIDLPVWTGDDRYTAQMRGHKGLWASWCHDNQSLVVSGRSSRSPEAISFAKERGPFDFVFIDGDHTYQAVRTDFETYRPFVQKDGVLVLHDIFRRTAIDEVWKLWHEIKESGYKTVELRSEPDQQDLGIGLVLL